jgi:hypothetical protein
MTLRTAGAILIAGLSLVTTLRFSRVLGAELQSGGTFADAIEQFFHPEKSPLSTFHSFGEFFMFAKTIEIIEDSGLQYGRTYAFVVLDLIPGVIFPEKTEIIDHWSAGRFVPNYSRSGRGQLWPQGFYGEGYMNFGVLGLLAICFFFGWFERWTEGLLRDNGTTLTIPRWYMGCMFASALIVGVRQDVNTIFNSSVLQLIAFVITRELVSLWIPRPDWKRHLDPRIPAQREAMTDYLRSRSSGY